jgi:hypothetical protein
MVQLSSLSTYSNLAPSTGPGYPYVVKYGCLFNGFNCESANEIFVWKQGRLYDINYLTVQLQVKSITMRWWSRGIC